MNDITPYLPDIYDFWAATQKHAEPRKNQNLEGLEIWFKKNSRSNESLRYSSRLFSTVGAAKNSFSRDIRWIFRGYTSAMQAQFPFVDFAAQSRVIMDYFYQQLSFLPSNILQKNDGRDLIKERIQAAINAPNKFAADDILINLLATHLS